MSRPRFEGAMGLLLIALTIAAVVVLYFRFNPLGHDSWFITRRFINWFPLGMSYAFLYMARYNLNVAANAFGSSMSNEAFGLIFAAGTTTYGLSFLVTGPLVDRIGGRKGILIATLGACASNILIGLATYFIVHGVMTDHLVSVFAVLYSINMFFQSFGGVSIIKVKAYWFHVRERGIFGAIFGTLISFGVYLAFDWGQAIATAAKAKPTSPNWLHDIFDSVLGIEAGGLDAIWLVFFVPAAILLVWAAIDWFLIMDTPAGAGLKDFDTHDASSGEMDREFTALELLKRIFTHPVILMIAFIEFTTGVVRNGIMQWYFRFAAQVKQPGAEFFHDHWGLLLCISGIAGGFTAGHISDRFFHSRRGPPVAISGAIMFLALAAMTGILFSSPIGVGVLAVTVGFLTISIHSLMSGTAAADFGGRKATATASGITDGFVYLGSGVQSASLGYLTTQDWRYWPAFLVPFALLGFFLALKMWRALPEATKRYLLVVEKVQITIEEETTVTSSELEAF